VAADDVVAGTKITAAAVMTPMARCAGDAAATNEVPLPLPTGLADGFGLESSPTTEVDSPQIRWVPGSRRLARIRRGTALRPYLKGY
jgi:hypothetical protein